jgi:uncharacterized protein
MKTLRPVLLFGPGAGAPSSSAWMQQWAQRLTNLQMSGATVQEVARFDYPYRREGRKAPDRQPALIAAHTTALRDLAARSAGSPVVLVGKSMGARIGCHVAADHPTEVAAILCLGYPLKSGASGALRDEVLLRLRTPVLFVQGTRDPLCPLALLEATRARMTAPNEIHIVDGGNHSLELPAKARAQQEESHRQVIETVRAFLEKFLRG